MSRSENDVLKHIDEEGCLWCYTGITEFTNILNSLLEKNLIEITVIRTDGSVKIKRKKIPLGDAIFQKEVK